MSCVLNKRDQGDGHQLCEPIGAAYRNRGVLDSPDYVHGFFESSIERFDLVGEAFISLRNLTVEGSLTVITCPGSTSTASSSSRRPRWLALCMYASTAPR